MAALPESIWIVHADPQARALLRRFAGAVPSAEGSPGDFAVDAAPAPRAVVLHVGSDLSSALDFAHRARLLHPRAGWVLLRDERIAEEALSAAFADLGAEILAWPSEAEQLSAAVARAGRGAPTGLRARRQRDALVRRCAHMLGDLSLPDLGGLQSARVVIRGEPGTGKLLAARVIHALADPPGALVHAPCAGPRALSELAARLATAAAGSAEERLVVCLDRPERLTREQQQELAGWIELGPPSLALDPERTVWIALLVELAGAVPLLEPTLALALGGREIVLPPLRHRPGVAERFAEAVLRSLAEASGGRVVRPLSSEALAAIRSAPWPDNFRELEAALRRVWALGGTEPIGPAGLGLGVAPEAAAAVPAAPSIPTAMRASKGLARPAERRTEPPQGPPAAGRPANRALLQALAHSLRNPLVSLKTFSTLLPEHFAEEDFRERFRAQTDRDLASVEGHLDRLARFAELSPGPGAPVDVAALLEAMLHERRSEIRSRRLLVLSELGADAPWALGSEAALRFAFGALLDVTFAQIRDRQDLYVACRRPAAAPGGNAPLRILLRFHGAPLVMQPGAGPPRAASLELVLAEAALEPYGGRISYESLAGDEQVLRVDLPAAAAEK
jgi:DNA-binding NtrC family response regulator